MLVLSELSAIVIADWVVADRFKVTVCVVVPEIVILGVENDRVAVTLTDWLPAEYPAAEALMLAEPTPAPVT
jgi:hypothetical protein